MDPLRLAIAIGPIAAYLFAIGLLNLSRRPIVVSGGRDLLALGLAASGLAVVGPMELFFPEPAAAYFGGVIWFWLLALYLLLVVLTMLYARPRLVVYNASVEQVRPALAQCISELDDAARWAGDQLASPKLGIQLHVDGFAPLRNVILVSAGETQNRAGWRRLHRELKQSLSALTVSRNLFGGVLLVVAVLTASVAYGGMLLAQEETVAAWVELTLQ